MMRYVRSPSFPCHRAAAIRQTIYLPAIACLLCLGCQNPPNNAWPPPWLDVLKPKPALTITTTPADDPPTAESAAPLAALQVGFNILRVQVPRGTFSESGKIWNHLDEQVLPADVAAHLQRNGLRVARGQDASWAPIKALLDAEKDIVSNGTAVSVGGGTPLSFVLDPAPHDQTLFLYRSDGSWPGATLLGSVNVLRIEYLFSVDKPDSIVLEIMPEIRLQPGEQAVTPETWGHPPPPRPRIFRELSAKVESNPGDFLAFGPSQSAHRAHTMGHLLLTQEIDGRPYEYMFFISPRVIFKTLPTGKNAARGGPADTPPAR